MARNDDDEPKVWVTALKLLAIALLLIAGVGLALWFAKDMDNGQEVQHNTDQWGISKDSPVRMKR